MIPSAFLNQMNLVDFIKMELPVKIPYITDLSNISFATILTNIFSKHKSFLFSCFVDVKQKRFRMVLQEKMYRNKNYQNYK